MRVDEKDWQATVERAARLRRWLVYHTYDPRKSSPGFPDLVLARPPRVIFAELKSEKGKLEPEQRIWYEALRGCPMVEMYVWKPSDWPQIDAVLV